MPLYALDEENRLIAARDADPFRRYRCVECRLLLQKRAGRERRPHFYHLQSTPQCLLYSTSIDHLALQSRLKEKIPKLILERPFPDILRIADLCWEEEKLIFEIQCSPIHQNEVVQRAKDYGSQGYQLVWLLDDRLYNQRSMRLSEIQLRTCPCYYFALRSATVYDQHEVWLKEERLERGPPLPLDLSKPLARSESLPLLLTEQLERRRGHRPFSGDLFDRILRHRGYLEKLLEHEKAVRGAHNPERPLQKMVKNSFYESLEFFLRESTEESESEVESGMNRESQNQSDKTSHNRKRQ